MQRSDAALTAFIVLALATPALATLRPPSTRPRHHAATPRRTDAPPRNGGVTCRLDLSAASSAGAETCWTDDRVGGRAGVLLYDCSGDGVASASFAGANFTGTISDGIVSLRLGTEFPFSDGCRWSSVQTIRGDVAARRFEYEYREFPKANDTACDPPCHATASLAGTGP